MEARYRGLLEAAPDAMVVVDQAGEIVLLNVQAEKQFGYRRDELVGQPVTNIIPEGFAERLIADALRSAEDALAQQIGTGIELVARRKDGSDFPIEIMLSPLDSAEGILVTAAIRDISVRKQAEATCSESRRTEPLQRGARPVRLHRLATTCRSRCAWWRAIPSCCRRRYKGKLDADADEFIAFAVDGASRMQRLIQDLLAYSRVGTKGRDLLPTSSEDALDQAIVNLRGAHRGQRRDRDPRSAAGRAGRRDAAGPAISRTSSATPSNTRAPASPGSTSPPRKNGGTNWIFSVKDNGLGIDPAVFRKDLRMFQRLHKRDEFAGTGIGLAICKKIVERHGGSISVDSQPGQGSTFGFTLANAERKS